MLAKLRHDLRTPINAILGYCDLLREDLARSQLNGLDDLGKIAAAGRQLLAVIDTELSDEHFGNLDKHLVGSEIRPSTRQSNFTAASRAFPSERRSAIAGRILVVDDQPENRDVLVKHLERQGHSTAQAEDGQRAIAMLSREAFDLVLLDVAMPEMEGYLVLEHMKADPQLRHLPVIMISAVDEIETVVRCIEAGAEDFLPNHLTLRFCALGSMQVSRRNFCKIRSEVICIGLRKPKSASRMSFRKRPLRCLSPSPPMPEPFRISWAYEPSTELGGDSFGYHWIDRKPLGHLPFGCVRTWRRSRTTLCCCD